MSTPFEFEEDERETDPSDAATQREMKDREALIEHARRQKTPEPTGACFYCEEPVEEGRRWCDAECRDLHDAQERLRARQGRA